MYDTEHYPFRLKPLPYHCHALTPCISARTLFFHHNKHLQAYVDNLNKALASYPAYHQWNLEKLLTNLDGLPDEIRTAVHNNAGGVYNHQLYFDSMTGCRNEPCPIMKKAIQDAFGSCEEWKKQMKEAAVSQFGSGWAWLVTDGFGALKIVKTSNQDTPLPLHPLLLVDVWEHAYYLQYQNRRPEYADNWFCLINWKKVAERYAGE